jgi:hypothetical protein
MVTSMMIDDGRLQTEKEEYDPQLLPLLIRSIQRSTQTTTTLKLLLGVQRTTTVDNHSTRLPLDHPAF